MSNHFLGTAALSHRENSVCHLNPLRNPGKNSEHLYQHQYFYVQTIFNPLSHLQQLYT